MSMNDVYYCMVSKFTEDSSTGKNKYETINITDNARFSFRIESDITFEGSKCIFSIYGAIPPDIYNVCESENISILVYNINQPTIASAIDFHIDNIFPRIKEASIKHISLYGTQYEYWKMLNAKINKQYSGKKNEIIKQILTEYKFDFNEDNVDSIDDKSDYDYSFINQNIVDILNFMGIKWTITNWGSFVYLHSNLDDDYFNPINLNDLNYNGMLISKSKSNYGTYEVSMNSGVLISPLSEIPYITSDSKDLLFSAANVIVTHCIHWLNYDGSYMTRFICVDKKRFGDLMDDVNYMHQTTSLMKDYKRRMLIKENIEGNYPILLGDYNLQDLPKIKYDLDGDVAGLVRKVQPWIGEKGNITVPRNANKKTIIVRDIDGNLYSIGEIDDDKTKKDYIEIKYGNRTIKIDNNTVNVT